MRHQLHKVGEPLSFARDAGISNKSVIEMRAPNAPNRVTDRQFDADR